MLPVNHIGKTKGEISGFILSIGNRNSNIHPIVKRVKIIWINLNHPNVRKKSAFTDGLKIVTVPKHT